MSAYTRIWPIAAAAVLLAGCSASAAPPPRPSPDRQMSALLEAARWPAPADAVVLSLASRFIAARADEAGYRFFSERAAAVPERPLFLALQGLFQARMAGQVFLLRRIAWVEEAAARLDRAAAQDGVSRVIRGLTLARLPERFHRAGAATSDLRWALASPDSPLQTRQRPPGPQQDGQRLPGPQQDGQRPPGPERTDPLPDNIAQGLRRAAWQALAYAHATAGRMAESREALARSGAANLDEESPPLVVPYSVSAKEGFRFGPPRLRSMGNVHVATGYDFSDLAFVVTSAGVVAIDAGTTPESAAAALSAFRQQVTAAPLVAVLVTHAHWDHVGGLPALAGPGVEVVASARYPEELARERQAGAARRWFFGEGFRMETTLSFTPTRTISERTTMRYGDTAFDLVPVQGGETEDALLVHLPASGLLFAGDAFMPYVGAPFLAEGSPEKLLETIGIVLALAPRQLVHGHPPLDDFYTAAALQPLRAALAELTAAAGTAIRQGRPLAAILDDNLLPPVLESHPEAVMAYLLMRDQFVTRLHRQRTGYWQPDGEGIEILSAADRARALALLAGGEERAFSRAAGKLLASGDEALALELALGGLASFPASADLAALRDSALDALRARNQQLNPFKFIIYSEMRGAETPPLLEPEGALQASGVSP